MKSKKVENCCYLVLFGPSQTPTSKLDENFKVQILKFLLFSFFSSSNSEDFIIPLHQHMTKVWQGFQNFATAYFPFWF
jgi:hypothetical protein